MIEYDKSTAVFAKPPLTQVALAFSYEPLAKLQQIHLGAWWQEIKDIYVGAEELPPFPPMLDQFVEDSSNTKNTTGTISQFMPQITFGAPFPRYSFFDQHKTRLLQIQKDVIVSNWVKKEPSEEYPQYLKTLRPEFEKRWQQFCGFLANQDLGKPKVLQCEVSTVNTLYRGAEWNSVEDISKIIAPWRGSDPNSLPAAEAVNIHTAFLIPETKGRVQMTINPGMDLATGKSVLTINITSRVRVESEDSAIAMKGLDLAHIWAVRGFTGFTTENMHNLWQRK